ncbi:hypothetical protein GIB67_003472, partial [Kingdonia uniflora]
MKELLMDVRDKLLFEPEYAGNRKEKIPPKSPLCIPWSWLLGVLCILQEKEVNNVSGGICHSTQWKLSGTQLALVYYRLTRRPPEIDQENWLKDAVLGLFPDTRNCSPNLANFFQSEKRSLRASKQSKGAPRPF